jgi:hypothetical protein
VPIYDFAFGRARLKCRGVCSTERRKTR